jgi:hypothetical protein
MRNAPARDVQRDERELQLERPRLLNFKQAAAYVGVSFWTVRDWIIAGHIPIVHLPPLRAREGDRQKQSLRRVLIDREDLDRFIEARKRRWEPMNAGTVEAQPRDSSPDLLAVSSARRLSEPLPSVSTSGSPRASGSPREASRSPQAATGKGACAR